MRRRSVLYIFMACVLAFACARAGHARELADFAQQVFQPAFQRQGVAVQLEARDKDGLSFLEARSQGETLGWAFSTWAVVRSVGYSGQPVDIFVALDPAKKVVAAELVRQDEPILIIGISKTQLDSFVAGLKGLDIAGLGRLSTLGAGRPADALAGATVSSSVFRDAIIRSSRLVARAGGVLGGGRILREKYEPADWRALEAQGAIAQRRVTGQEFAEAVGAASDQPDQLLLEAYAALATPAGIGRNLFGRHIADSLAGTTGPDDNILFVGSRGLLSVLGGNWRDTGLFERLAVVQDGKTIRLTKAMHRDLDAIAAPDAPDLRERGLFILPASSGFDPARPFRLALMLTRNAPDREPQSATFFLDARLPGGYLAPPPGEAPALWTEIWRARGAEIAALLAMLTALFGILLFQDRLVENLALYKRTRIVFLGLTLAFLGLYAKAQLSVVQVITFVHALRGEFRWELFLLDPMIFILWGFVALAMLFWGRGVFCGWLCPFGALQELLNEAARRLGVRQWEPPWGLHERLGMIKYLIFLGIFAISLNSMDAAFRAAEAEPFKTIIALHFMRAAPFVLYAAATLAAGLFVRRAFCRYLCPLGGALALPARLRIFEWLKRRPQCGRECRQCAVKCPVQAINPLGAISPNECIYCLNCQSMYHDPKVCKGLAGREARRQGLEAMIASTKQKEAGHD
jgi:NosR/NirI family transcriptional regulator, nitrite reductase regulator